jgi:hypothetical protein
LLPNHNTGFDDGDIPSISSINDDENEKGDDDEDDDNKNEKEKVEEENAFRKNVKKFKITIVDTIKKIRNKITKLENFCTIIPSNHIFEMLQSTENYML